MNDIGIKLLVAERNIMLGNVLALGVVFPDLFDEQQIDNRWQQVRDEISSITGSEASSYLDSPSGASAWTVSQVVGNWLDHRVDGLSKFDTGDLLYAADCYNKARRDMQDAFMTYYGSILAIGRPLVPNEEYESIVDEYFRIEDASRHLRLKLMKKLGADMTGSQDVNETERYLKAVFKMAPDDLAFLSSDLSRWFQKGLGIDTGGIYQDRWELGKQRLRLMVTSIIYAIDIGMFEAQNRNADGQVALARGHLYERLAVLDANMMILSDKTLYGMTAVLALEFQDNSRMYTDENGEKKRVELNNNPNIDLQLSAPPAPLAGGGRTTQVLALKSSDSKSAMKQLRKRAVGIGTLYPNSEDGGFEEWYDTGFLRDKMEAYLRALESDFESGESKEAIEIIRTYARSEIIEVIDRLHEISVIETKEFWREMNELRIESQRNRQQREAGIGRIVVKARNERDKRNRQARLSRRKNRRKK
jgi:hypothetical protein